MPPDPNKPCALPPPSSPGGEFIAVLVPGLLCFYFQCRQRDLCMPQGRYSTELYDVFRERTTTTREREREREIKKNYGVLSWSMALVICLGVLDWRGFVCIQEGIQVCSCCAKLASSLSLVIRYLRYSTNGDRHLTRMWLRD
jgi:hypothetical protein